MCVNHCLLDVYKHTFALKVNSSVISEAFLCVIVFLVTLYAIGDILFCYTLMKNKDVKRSFCDLWAVILFLKLKQHVPLTDKITSG